MTKKNKKKKKESEFLNAITNWDSFIDLETQKKRADNRKNVIDDNDDTVFQLFFLFFSV